LAKHIELEEFEAIYHRYKNMVFKLAYLTLGDAQEADETMLWLELLAEHCGIDSDLPRWLLYVQLRSGA